MLKLVQPDTVAIEPILPENCLGLTEGSAGLTGKGIVKIKNVPELTIGDTVFYNAIAGSYVSQLNLVVCNISDVLLIEKD